MEFNLSGAWAWILKTTSEAVSEVVMVRGQLQRKKKKKVMEDQNLQERHIGERGVSHGALDTL